MSGISRLKKRKGFSLITISNKQYLYTVTWTTLVYYDEDNMRHQCDLRDYIDWLGQSMHYVKHTAKEVLSKGEIAGVIVKHQDSL